jgi:hypothetical protein
MVTNSETGYDYRTTATVYERHAGEGVKGESVSVWEGGRVYGCVCVFACVCVCGVLETKVFDPIPTTSTRHNTQPSSTLSHTSS